ncbi:CNH domain-containing protein [Lipomyces orientalis]|uniref:CNH domain-containing protein n=1 Tax=Lipomyces orientalis TaxID=1233043 RepID=A0ACC3TVT5_9ASCO
MSWDGYSNMYSSPPSQHTPRAPPRPPPHLLPSSRPAMINNNDERPALPPKVPLHELPNSRDSMRTEFSVPPAPDWGEFTRYGGIVSTPASTPAPSVKASPLPRDPSIHPRRDVFDRILEAQTVDYSNISIFSTSPPGSDYGHHVDNSYSSQWDLGRANLDRRPDMEIMPGPVQRASSPTRPPPPSALVVPTRSSPPLTSPSGTTEPQSQAIAQQYRSGDVNTFSRHMTIQRNKSITRPTTRPPLPHEILRSPDSQSSPAVERHQVLRSPTSSHVPDTDSNPLAYVPQGDSSYVRRNSPLPSLGLIINTTRSSTVSGSRSASNSPSRSPIRDSQSPVRNSPLAPGNITPFSSTFLSTSYTEDSDNLDINTPMPNVPHTYSPLDLLKNVGYIPAPDPDLNLGSDDDLDSEHYSLDNSPVPPQHRVHSLDNSPVPPLHGVPFEDFSDDYDGGHSDRFSVDDRSYSQSSDAFSYSTSEPKSPSFAESGTSTPPKPPQHFTPYGSIRYTERGEAGVTRPAGLQKWSSWSSLGGVSRPDVNALGAGPQPVRANTTGRVPLQADGNLRSQQRQVSQPFQQPLSLPDPEYQEYRVQLQDNEYLHDRSGDENVLDVEDVGDVNPQVIGEELYDIGIPPTEPLRLRSTINDQPTLAVQPSRPQSPAESATSTHADTGVMMRLGLPTELPDSSPNLPSEAPSETSRTPLLQTRFGKQTMASRDYRSCQQPWLLSQLYIWVRRVMAREANVMRENGLVELIRGLFTHWIPTLRNSTADENASAAIASFILQGVMDKPDAIHVRVPQDYESAYIARLASMSGVLTVLAGKGCYSTKVHSEEEPVAWQCYSLRCSRTLRSLPRAVPQVTNDFLNASDWSAIVPTEVLRSLPKKEVIRQSVIFEIIQGEHNYLEELRRFVVNFRDKPVAKDLWAATNELLRINTECLYGPLLVRQASNPIINGIGDIFHDWLLTVQKSYELYASILEDAKRQYKLEAARDPAFQQFDKDYKSQSRDEYGAVWLRLIRYPLLLKRIRDETDPPVYEGQKLKEVLDKMNSVILGFQARYAEGQQRYALRDLEETIKFTDRKLEVNLYLNAKSRQLVHQGRLAVKMEGHMRHSRYLILLDNYLLIANVSTGSRPNFDIVYHPIPIDLLVLVSNNDSPVNARFHMRSKSQTNLAPILNNRSSMPQSPEELKEKAQAMLNTKDDDADKLYPFRIEHLGRKGSRYTLYVASENDRREWCKCIETAKRGFAVRMQSFRAEPFGLEVISDLAFGYGSEDKIPEIPVQSTVGVVERALRDAEFDIGEAAKQSVHVLINSNVNCAATFYPDDLGARTSVNRSVTAYLQASARKQYTLVGCDWGVYLSDGSSPRFWVPILSLTKVKQIHILPDFGIAVILANKTLMAYDLEALLAANPMHISDVSPTMHPSKRIEEWLARRGTQHEKISLTPQQISRYEFTGFSVGVLRGRTIIVGFKNNSSILGSADDTVTTLKIFEPVAGKLCDFGESDVKLDDDYVRLDRVLLMRKDVNGTGRCLAAVDIARETESVPIQKQISDVTVLKKSIVLHAGQDFEFMPLPIRTLVQIPIPDSASNDFLRKLPKTGTKPLGIFRIAQQEFLLCYSTYCIFCDQYGQPSRSAYIKLECTARAVAFSKPYIVAFDNNFVEVRSVDSGDKKQIIVGANVRLLRSQVYHDDPDNEKHGYVNPTGRTGNDIIFSIAHPEVRGRQLLMKLKLNKEVFDQGM